MSSEEEDVLASGDGCAGEGGQDMLLQLGSLAGWYAQTLAALASEEGLRGGPLGYSGAEESAEAGQGAWQGFGPLLGHASAETRSSLQILLPDVTQLAPYTGALKPTPLSLSISSCLSSTRCATSEVIYHLSPDFLCKPL